MPITNTPGVPRAPSTRATARLSHEVGDAPVQTGPGPVASAQGDAEAPQPADGYRVFLDGSLRTDAVVGGHAQRVDTGADGRAASFQAEVGKPLFVDVDPARLGSDVAKVELVYGLRGEAGDKGRLLLNDGERDGRTGAVLLREARIDLGDDLRGTLDLNIVVTGADGRERSSWAPQNGVLLIPKAGARLTFDDDWSVSVDATAPGGPAAHPLRAGQRLEIAYDAERLTALAGDGAQTLTAFVSFNGDAPLQLPLVLDPPGDDHDGMFLPAVRVPYDAHKVDVWFRATGPDGEVWDSAFGKNYALEVGLPEANADSSWKRLLVDKPGFPGLTDSAFDAIGPYDQGYNCIGWTVGARDQWVWPGDTIADFDALYAQQGYQPLDSADLDSALAHDPTLEKVAIFGHRHGDRASVLHGARMLDDGQWSSKMGDNALIRHADPRAVEGTAYGKVLKVYARPR